MPLLITVACGLLSGLLVAGVWFRWPRLDPANASMSPALVALELRRHPRWRQALQRRADPHGVMGALLIVMMLVLLIMIAAFGLVAFMVRTRTGFARWDASGAEWGAHHQTSASTRGLEMLTWLGGTAGGLVTLGLTIVSEARRRIEHRRGWTRTRSVMAFLAVVVVGQNILTNTVKLIVGRARPSIAPLTGFSGYSFPSGHSAQAAAMFAAVALVIGRSAGRRGKALWAGSAAGVAVVVAMTRVMLGVHWLTDAFGGLALGWGWFALVSLAFGGRWLHFGAPIELAQKSTVAVAAGDPGRASEP